ncbi:MAG: hypothetical protein ACRC5H_04240 [Treponemataceae bacterium]
MNKKYSLRELDVIKSLIYKNGHLTYQSVASLENYYFLKTGVHRASGALYMAAWRLERGYYDKYLKK